MDYENTFNIYFLKCEINFGQSPKINIVILS